MDPGRPGERRMSATEQRETAERGRRLSGQLTAAARDENWPYLLVIVVSIANDVLDIFDVNLLFGLDQVFDFLSFTVMLGARLFIRGSEIGWLGWTASKVFAAAVEIIPLLGAVPTWTISALYVWQHAVRVRRTRQQQAAAQAAGALPGEGGDDKYEGEEEPSYA